MKIKFVPLDIEIEGNPHKTLLETCIENKIQIASICKGIPSCGECRVKIKEGEYNVNPPSQSEIAVIGSSYYLDGRRLSCQVRCFGNVTVDVSEQIERSKVQRKKTRGFQWSGSRSLDSKAVQGTLILEEADKENKKK